MSKITSTKMETQTPEDDSDPKILNYVEEKENESREDFWKRSTDMMRSFSNSGNK